MKKITGGITFSIGVFLLTFSGYILIFDTPLNGKERLGFLAFFLFGISITHYTYSTKFWTQKRSVIQSLDKETEIIKKKIEKGELLAKLENLEKNE